ncbi:hypothetical protein V1264_012288 [Littorina saxatilis]|uniref:CUB domain-containing protein n=1 Tax=Littorina saxatilis TaxID=31220 RepID=A0AAN9BW46_9CAEN
MIYYSHHNFVKVRVPRSSVGKAEYSFQLQAIPDCVRELQVFCFSEKKGFIQTPGWNGVTKYPNEMDSCVTLLIPTDHLVMVSLVSLDLETLNDCAYDALTIHIGKDCPGDGEKICEMKDLTPTIYDAADAISFQFISNNYVQKTGFRLLYSFHPNSSKPEQLPDGKWNCSVPHFPEFQQHFACSHTVFCSKGQDKLECRAGNLCGRDAIKLGDSCYRRLTPYSPYTWDEAAQYCESSGAQMMDLDSAEEWKFLVNEAQYLGSKNIFVGLKLASSTVPEM